MLSPIGTSWQRIPTSPMQISLFSEFERPGKGGCFVGEQLSLLPRSASAYAVITAALAPRRSKFAHHAFTGKLRREGNPFHQANVRYSRNSSCLPHGTPWILRYSSFVGCLLRTFRASRTRFTRACFSPIQTTCLMCANPWWCTLHGGRRRRLQTPRSSRLLIWVFSAGRQQAS